jgi:hypothetical protein
VQDHRQKRLWLKIVRVGLLSDSLHNLLKRELLILSKLSHPGLMPYLDSYHISGHLIV